MAQILGVDVDEEVTTWSVLGAGGVQIGVVKLSEANDYANPTAPAKVNAMVAAGIPFRGGYHWDDPIVTPQANADQLESVLGTVHAGVNFLMLDDEQYWASWHEWYLQVTGKGRITHLFAPQALSDHYQATIELVAKFGLPVLLYSAHWVVDGYTKPVEAWMGQYPQCLAVYTSAKGNLQWSDVQKLCPLVTSYPSAYYLPGGAPPLAWQWSGGTIVVPGKAGAIDLWTADSVQFQAFVSSAPPPPPPDPVVQLAAIDAAIQGNEPRLAYVEQALHSQGWM